VGPATRLPRVASGSLAAPLRVRGKDASHRPLQTNLHHEHSWISLDFLRLPSGFAPERSSRGEPRPRPKPRAGDPRAGGVKRRLTALLPLRSAGLTAPRRSEGRVPLGTVPRASGASGGTPPGTACSAVPEASKAASDALYRCPARASLRTVCPGARTAASAPLVKEGGAPRPSAPFHRRRAPSAPACAGASGAARRLPAIDTIHEHDRMDHTGPLRRARLPSRVEPGR